MRWLLALVIVVILVFTFMGPGTTDQKPAAPAPQAESVAPAATPDASAPPPAAQAAAPAPPAVDPNLLYSRMQAAARQVGVELRGVQVQPGNVWVAVAWKGGDATLGGEFLDECRKQNLIRDFNVNNPKMGMEMDPNGVPLNTAQYQVYLP